MWKRNYEATIHLVNEETKAFYAEVIIKADDHTRLSSYSGSWFYDGTKCLNLRLLEKADEPLVEKMEQNYQIAQESGVSMQSYIGEVISWSV